jgi:NADP-dependent 3-hydroxy acid dehydrogenase YdfG
MKTVLITGATSGIGLACAKVFARNGYNLVLAARNWEKLTEVKKEIDEVQNGADFPISKKGVEVKIYKLDVQSKTEVESFFQQLEQEDVNIDVLINNAGLALGMSNLVEGDVEDWENMIDTNVKGLLYVTKFALPKMLERNEGHIINIGSIAGVTAYANGAVYCATKAAVKFISDALRKELVAKNIRVTNIQPGMTETNFSLVRFKGDEEKAKKVYSGIKPMTGDDVAETIFFAANSPEHVQIGEITLTPTNQASPEVVHKQN